MAATVSEYQKSYNSFSGVDIKAVFGNKVVGTLQAISYSISREKAPLYTMGSADPRSFSRGKRGIAGTLIFIVFDRHSFLSILGGLASDKGLKFQSDKDDIVPAFEFPNANLNGPVSEGTSLETILNSISGTTAADTVNNQESPISSVGGDQELASAWYADQVPPFDVVLAAANEYGALAVMKIFGVELLNEGSGMSIDDIVVEQQHTYVARSILPWTPVPSANLTAIAAQGSLA